MAMTVTATALHATLYDGDRTNDPFVLSVRSFTHYEAGHIPGAAHGAW